MAGRHGAWLQRRDPVAYRVIYGRRPSPTCVCPSCDLNAMLNPVIITFVVGLFLLIAVTAWYWRVTDDIEWSVRWYLYAYVTDVIVAIATLVALILGILITRVSENITVSQTAITATQLLLNSNYPYSRRFIYDAPRGDVPTAAAPVEVAAARQSSPELPARGGAARLMRAVRLRSVHAAGVRTTKRGVRPPSEAVAPLEATETKRTARRAVLGVARNRASRHKRNGAERAVAGTVAKEDRAQPTYKNERDIGDDATDESGAERSRAKRAAPDKAAETVPATIDAGTTETAETATVEASAVDSKEVAAEAGGADANEAAAEGSGADANEVAAEGGGADAKEAAREDARNRRVMFESVTLDVIFQTIAQVLSSDAVPAPEYVHMLARMFDKAFVRNGWRAKRPYVPASTQLFVAANFFPRARNAASLRRSAAYARQNRGCGCLCRGGTCCYGCTASNILHPVTIVGLLVVVCVAAMSWCYWTMWVDERVSAAEQWEVYCTVMVTLISVPTLFLLVYAYVDSEKQADFTDVVGDDSLQMLLFANYPESVAYYLQLRSCDAFAQRVRPPPPSTIDPLQRRVFEATYSTALFQAMEQTLLVETLPNSGSRVDWYSNSLSDIWQYYWRRDQYNWSKLLRNYIDCHYLR